MEKLDFNENQSVFRVGESSDKMFLLVKGKVGIFLPKNETKDADPKDDASLMESARILLDEIQLNPRLAVL